MVKPVVPRLGGLCLVAVVALEKSAGNAVCGPYHYLSDLAVGNGIAVGIHDINIILRRRLAHRTELGHRADKVAYRKGGLGLTEALHYFKPGRFLEFSRDLGVERLACRCHVVDGRKVVHRKILLYHHAEHGGRSAEGRDIVFCEHRQNVSCAEAVKVVDKHRALAEPLTVQLAPERLAPAGIRNGQVQSVALTAVPVSCGDVMTERICMRMRRHFGISGRAGGKEHERRVVSAGRVL